MSVERKWPNYKGKLASPERWRYGHGCHVETLPIVLLSLLLVRWLPLLGLWWAHPCNDPRRPPTSKFVSFDGLGSHHHGGVLHGPEMFIWCPRPQQSRRHICCCIVGFAEHQDNGFLAVDPFREMLGPVPSRVCACRRPRLAGSRAALDVDPLSQCVDPVRRLDLRLIRPSAVNAFACAR